MTTVTLDRKDATDRVGDFEMRVVTGERTSESEERWSRRSEMIATWLLDEWKRQQREIAQRN
ncbi:MAG TPA: hypothetical protein PLL20_13940 [Phycisphaerae bacterium]|nr:hypothetical protein [Phycisphaerae bacterium]HRR86021.1 hypothetical protein [Phycisphaerae bacterium]